MKRTKKMSKDEKMITWKKNGGGTFYMRRRAGQIEIIKPNQVFQAYDNEVPRGFRDNIVPTTASPITDVLEPKQADEVTFKKVVRSPGWFNVEDSNGKVLNENALREDEADEFIQKLME